ncbi:Replication protein A 70 kDa DNA-binding subunit [Wickerhamomyces ciferrii]|uniref:Replication protein A subunit n=1 Tax=Wickerhamomyces ciferrii (strain ATCC 14091 / BCRC 22168 / CBS 111 / JCM 3599 / NBRC 0793 / NRRL Y-1031 F-60-10) TaxID=1206466 RepID=K0KKI6_WICCF|nr:Replication protein A 70 kDa DNA-binding subunit [Wickerhamomyces ciferrii]CCH45720.1 Replication protein A 70 kDa DNA-binding subunit [Wickerhamomyces ciferrii]
MAELDTGILKKLFTSEQHWNAKAPATLQVSNVRPIPNEAGKRLRLLVSDGVFSTHAVVRPEGVAYCEENGFQRSSIVTIQRYEIERMGAGNKHVIIISDLVIKQSVASKVGTAIESLDDYFRAHPEEDIYQSAEAGEENTPTPQAEAPKQEQPKQSIPQPQSSTNTNKASSNQKKPSNIYAIDQLSPYQNIWTIKARVSFKGEMRTWSNQRGEGKLFNVNLLDETDEIRATAFNDNAEKFYNLLQEGKAYYVSKARIQPSRPQFSNLKHPYELQLDRDTVIEECFDADDVPKLSFDFVKLNKIQDLEADSIIDVVGVIKEVNPHFQITSKAGRAYDRRDITVVDDSQFAISVGLWNKTALEFDTPEGTVIAIKGAKVSDFNGKTLSITPSGTITTNPDAPEAYAIKGWYDAQGRNENFQTLKTELGTRKTSIEERKTIGDVQNLELGLGEKPDYFTIKSSVNFLKTDNFSYPACSSEGCNRKVIEQHDGTWRCEKCDINHAVPLYRYILTISVVDPTGQLWVTLFEDQAKALLGYSANDLVKYKEEDNSLFTSIVSKIQMNEFEFRIRARQDNYNGQVRIRYNAVNVNKIDFSNEAEYLVKKFESLGA